MIIMEWNLETLQEKLSAITEISKECDETFKETIQNVALQDTSKESYETLYETMTEEEKDYHRLNEKYKAYISGFSDAYIQMSECYVGPELPYDLYKKHFKKEDTYLDSKKGIEEMYALFIFFMMVESSMNNLVK
jgi:predicted nuclease with TOPRIM domain